MIAMGSRAAPPTPLIRSIFGRVLPGLVLSNRLFQIFQPELQLIVGQLLGTATEAMAEQALDQHPELIVLSVQFAVLLRRRGHDIPQHLLQEFRIVRQSLEIDLHSRMMIDAAASAPAFPAGSAHFLPRQRGAAAGHRRAPLAAVEQRYQLRRRQRDPTGRGGRRPVELALFKPFRQQAKAEPVMPDQLDQARTTAAESIHRTIERVLRQALLHQHGQAHGAFPHVGDATGQIDTRTW